MASSLALMIALRPTASSDLAAVLEIEGDPEVSPWVTRWPADRHLEAIGSPDEAHLSILENDQLVGFVLLAGLNAPERVIELRRIAISRRGGGIGRAALIQTLDLAFSELRAERVWLDLLPHNERARHLYESSGFTLEGLLEDAHPSPDGLLPLLVMSIGREEWEARPTPGMSSLAD